MTSIIRYSRGHGPKDNTPQQLQADDFQSFVDAVKADTQAQKGTGWVSGPLAVAPDDEWHNKRDSMKYAIGKPHRCSQCAQSRRWIGGDIDNGKTLATRGFTPAMLVDLVQYMMPFASLIYTTHSHTAEIPRVRYIVELDRPATRDELKRASEAMRLRIDGYLREQGHTEAIDWDSAADAAELPLYLPGPDAQFHGDGTGQPVKLDELLAEVPERQAPPPRAPLDPSELSERAEILSFLAARIDNDGAGMEYDTWLRVLMGIHHETGGSDEGLQVALEFSSRSDKCDEALTEYKFRSFSPDHPTPVTMGTVEKMAEVGYLDLMEATENLTPEVAAEKPNLVAMFARLASKRLKAVPARTIWSRIKSTTKLPFSVLEDAASESAGGHGADGGTGEGVDHLHLAMQVIAQIGADNLIHVPGHVYRWRDAGVWRPADPEEVRQWVQRGIPHLVDEVSRGLVDGVTATLKTEIYRPEHRFNIGDPETINTPNGELVLVTGQWHLMPHEKTSYRTTQIPVMYDPAATAPRFVQFLSEVFPGDEQQQQALLEMMGYSLVAHCRHERFVILIGPGANGKSVVLDLLEALAGRENVAAVQPSQLDNPFQRAHLHEKLINIVSEIKQGTVLDDDALKGIVSGEAVTVEHKYGHPFVMHPFSTCWFGTNHMPNTRDFSDGLFRRTLILQFEQVFKSELGNHDPHLKDKLKAELPGVLNMALAAYARAVDRGFTMPDKSMQARDEWRLEADQVAQFVDDDCTTIPGGEVEIGELFDRYKSWAVEAGVHKTMTKKGFRNRLTQLGYGHKRTNSARYVTGIRLGRLPDGAQEYAAASGGF